MTGQQRRRQRFAFWTENHLPLWLWGVSERLGCLLLGHHVGHDPNAPVLQHDGAWDMCLWCMKPMPGRAECKACRAELGITIEEETTGDA